MSILLRDYSDLQRLSASGLLDILHKSTSFLFGTGRRCFADVSSEIPSSLQNHSERPITKQENVPDLDLEVNLPGKSLIVPFPSP